MLKRFPLTTLFAAAGLLYAAYVMWPRPVTETALRQQLAGAHCRFIHDIDHCAQRGFEPLRSLLLEQHDCDLWAVQCLSQFKSPEAVAGMISVLATKADVQTCDGVRPIRTLAVSYLGDSGNRAAIEPLKRLLASNPTETLSAGASGCAARLEDKGAIRAAIGKLE